MAEKKTTKAAEKKTATEKKTTTKKTTTKKATKKVEVIINAENIGFKAGDVYQALFAAENGLTVAQIAKAAKISEEETLLGMGWLFKEGKIKAEENLFMLA